MNDDANICHICAKPKAGPGSIYCSYPHGMVPDNPVDPDHPEGFWTWKLPENDSSDRLLTRNTMNGVRCQRSRMENEQ